MTDINYPASGGGSVDLNDGAGNPVTSQVNGTQRALDVGIDVAGVQIDPRAIRALTATDVVTANQGGTWNINNVSGTVSLPTGAATAAKQPALGVSGTASSDVITVQGIAGMTAIVVDGSGSTQPISGSVTVTQATAANLNATVTGTVAATQSGTWNINNVSGTISLPTGAATSAKQPALGTAGSASSDVITVQGIASMTALKVDASATTQPVSIAGRSKVLLYRNDYGSVNVTTSAYVQVTSSTSGIINRLYIADTSGSAIILATGGSGSEVDQLYIGPGGSDAPYELQIPASTRIAIKALDVSATSGQIIITALS